MSIEAVTGRVGVALLAGALALAEPAPAQRTGDGFLFGRPRASFAIRAGYDRALARSDVFSFVTERLTLGRGAFSSLTVATDLAARLSDRADLVFGASYSGSRSRSEFRDWVDQDNLPIEQTTSFDRVPLTVGLRIYEAQRGRSLGRLAWVPARYAPYIGVGVGVMWHRFRQVGDFVDFETLDVFGDEFDSSGWTMTAHGLAGVEVALGPRFFLVGESRYTWARATMRQAWVDFDRIDLSGFSVTAGIAVRM